MSIEQNKEKSRRLYVEVFGAGNADAADEILAEGCVSHGPGSPPAVGRDGIKRQAGVLRTAIPDLQVTLGDQLADGDRVASRWTGSGTHAGPLALPGLSLPPTGRPIAFSEIRIDRFEGEHIAESWFIPDRLTLWQQLGVLPESNPAPPSRPVTTQE